MPVGSPQPFRQVKQLRKLFPILLKGLPVLIFVMQVKPLPQSCFQMQYPGKKKGNL